MDQPNPFQKFLYLCGIRSRESHREWVSGIVAGRGRRRDLLLAVPNALVVLGVGIFRLAVGDRVLGTVMLIGAVVVLAIGAASASVGQRRARWLAARHRVT